MTHFLATGTAAAECHDLLALGPGSTCNRVGGDATPPIHGTHEQMGVFHAQQGFERIQEGDEASALKHFELALESDPLNANALIQWGIRHVKDQEDRAFQSIATAFRPDARPRPATAHSPQGQWLSIMVGRWYVERVEYESALRFYHMALTDGPPIENDCLAMQIATLVTPYPQSSEDADRVMKEYNHRMDTLLSKPNIRVDGIEQSDPYVFCMATTFYHELYLDQDLKLSLNQYYHVANRAFPSLSYKAERTQVKSTGNRLKIGVASAMFRPSSVTADFGETFARISRTQFEIVYIDLVDRFPWSKGGSTDSPYLESRKRAGDRVVTIDSSQGSDWIQQAYKTVEALELDVLLYLDLTMSRQIHRLGMARLANIQATTHGHPTTSGIDRDVMDFYISWGAAEIPDAQRHYTEELRLLPETSMHQYYTRRISASGRSMIDGQPFRQLKRRDFNVSEGTWYVCMQKPFKLHPKFDAMLAGIQSSDPNAQIILHDVDTEDLRSARRKRWKKAGLDLKRTHTLPSLAHHRLLALYSLADVVLDSYMAGGCTTTREALELGAIVVTYPAPYLGGRWSYAYLNQINVLDSVANSTSDYVRLAVHFGTNREAQQELRNRIQRNVAGLFEQDSAVQSWEDVLHSLVRTNDLGSDHHDRADL